jgi:spermidine/putrescine transport system permease protein
MAFFYLPILILVANSFNPARYSSRWQGVSLVWYRRLFESPEVWQALKITLVIAVSVTAVSVILGTAAAYALHRYGSSRLQKVHYTLIYQPLVVPEILMGISLLMAFVAAGVPLGLLTIFLAHVTFCVSFVAMTVLARLQDFDFSVIEAARDLGASPWQSTRKVLIPLLMPGIAAGALLAFTLSIDDFVITFFVAGPGSTTLPLRIYSMIKYGAPPMINALSTLLLLVTFAAVLASQRLARSKR